MPYFPMYFTVPPIKFLLSIVRDQPLNNEGRPVVALIDSYAATIAIWAGLDGQNRENALRHELWHAWEWQYLTEGMTDEQRCQMYANASQHFDEEYARQGGRQALASLTPAEELVDVESDFGVLDEEPAGNRLGELRLEPISEAFEGSPGGGQLWGTAHRRDCYGCGSFIWGNQIVNTREPYYLHAVEGRLVEGWVVDRACICPSCGAMQEWTEGVDLSGRPNCVPVAAPKLTTSATELGRERIAAFLSTNRTNAPLPAGT